MGRFIVSALRTLIVMCVGGLLLYGGSLYYFAKKRPQTFQEFRELFSQSLQSPSQFKIEDLVKANQHKQSLERLEANDEFTQNAVVIDNGDTPSPSAIPLPSSAPRQAPAKQESHDPQDVVDMLKEFFDLQQRVSRLEHRVQQLETENRELKQNIKAKK